MERLGDRGRPPGRPAVGRGSLVVLTVLLAMISAAAWAAQRPVVSQAVVSLTDDSGGIALFPGTSPLSPGASQVACLAVQAPGAYPGDEVMVLADEVSGDLAALIQVEVEVGSGGGYGDCTGFSGTSVFTGSLVDLAAVAGDGVPTHWIPASDGGRTFRITAEVPNDPVAQGKTAHADFVWRLAETGIRPTPTTPPPGPPTTPPPTRRPPATTRPPVADPADPAATPTGEGPLTPSTTPEATTPSVSSTTAGPPGPGGPAAGSGTGGGEDAEGKVLRLTPSVPAKLAATLTGVVEHPAPLLWPLLVAVVFLALQHRLDGRDPKLVGASRRQRDLTVPFGSEYPLLEEA